MRKFLFLLVFVGSALLTERASAQQTFVLSGRCVQAVFTPTVTISSAYTSGDVVGGIDSFLVFRTVGGSGVLMSCLLIDRANQKKDMTVLFYSRRPSSGTYVDSAAFAVNATDAGYLVRQVNIAAADYVTTGTYAVADIAAIGKEVYNSNGGKYLYAVIVTKGTPTWAAVGDVTLEVGVLQD